MTVALVLVVGLVLAALINAFLSRSVDTWRDDSEIED